MEPRLIEVDDIKTIFADGIATINEFGANLRITLFEYREWHGETVRWPVAVLIRPKTSFAAGVADMLRASHQRPSLALVCH